MFFKNIHVFAFTRKFDDTDLQVNLERNLFRNCGDAELSTFGWVRPIQNDSQLSYHAQGNTLICAKKEEKILPSQVVNDAVEEKVAALELSLFNPRSATRKEKAQIKEDVIFELLPRAFTRHTETHGYINTKHNIIVINTSSRAKAEDFLALLRKSVGSLPVTSISGDLEPSYVMSQWVKDESISSKLSMGSEIEMVSTSDHNTTVKIKNEDLCGSEVHEHLLNGKYVSKIALEYNESMSFMVSEDLSIKRIKFSDIVTSQNDDMDSDDCAKFEADFILMAGELNKMISDLHNEFGVNVNDYLEG